MIKDMEGVVGGDYWSKDKGREFRVYVEGLVLVGSMSRRGSMRGGSYRY